MNLEEIKDFNLNADFSLPVYDPTCLHLLNSNPDNCGKETSVTQEFVPHFIKEAIETLPNVPVMIFISLPLPHHEHLIMLHKTVLPTYTGIEEINHLPIASVAYNARQNLKNQKFCPKHQIKTLVKVKKRKKYDKRKSKEERETVVSSAIERNTGYALSKK